MILRSYCSGEVLKPGSVRAPAPSAANGVGASMWRVGGVVWAVPTRGPHHRTPSHIPRATAQLGLHVAGHVRPSQQLRYQDPALRKGWDCKHSQQQETHCVYRLLLPAHTGWFRASVLYCFTFSIYWTFPVLKNLFNRISFGWVAIEMNSICFTILHSIDCIKVVWKVKILNVSGSRINIKIKSSHKLMFIYFYLAYS